MRWTRLFILVSLVSAFFVQESFSSTPQVLQSGDHRSPTSPHLFASSSTSSAEDDNAAVKVQPFNARAPELQLEAFDIAKAFERLQQAQKQATKTHFESELEKLGCVQWRSLKGGITQAVLDIVKLMYNPSRGPFILTPGLTITYINEVL